MQVDGRLGARSFHKSQQFAVTGQTPAAFPCNSAGGNFARGLQCLYPGVTRRLTDTVCPGPHHSHRATLPDQTCDLVTDFSTQAIIHQFVPAIWTGKYALGWTTGVCLLHQDKSAHGCHNKLLRSGSQLHCFSSIKKKSFVAEYKVGCCLRHAGIDRVTGVACIRDNSGSSKPPAQRTALLIAGA
jgi:hypothetical protein